MQKNFQFSAIGYIKSGFPDKFGVPRQSGLVKSLVAELEILSEWQPEFALQGLEGYSHLWVTFVFHLNSNKKYHPKVHPPRMNGESIGVFATRSPHRPNPIGLSLAEIVKVEKNKLYLAGLDLVDGTPVLDIKPYLPQLEIIQEARGGWATSDEHQMRAIEVHFTDEAKAVLDNWVKKAQRIELKKAIEDILKQDPRPVIYRGFEEKGDSPYRQEHAFRLYEGDIHFKFLDSHTVEVFRIKYPV